MRNPHTPAKHCTLACLLVATLNTVTNVTAGPAAQSVNNVLPTTLSATAEDKMPLRGLSMEEVLRTFGAPAKRLPPVGDPPITRWVYPHYTVYFEDTFVIHSVARR